MVYEVFILPSVEGLCMISKCIVYDASVSCAKLLLLVLSKADNQIPNFYRFLKGHGYQCKDPPTLLALTSIFSRPTRTRVCNTCLSIGSSVGPVRLKLTTLCIGVKQESQEADHADSMDLLQVHLQRIVSARICMTPLGPLLHTAADSGTLRGASLGRESSHTEGISHVKDGYHGPQKHF